MRTPSYWCACKVWKALKNLDLLSYSPDFPRASYLDIRTLNMKQFFIVKRKTCLTGRPRLRWKLCKKDKTMGCTIVLGSKPSVPQVSIVIPLKDCQHIIESGNEIEMWLRISVKDLCYRCRAFVFRKIGKFLSVNYSSSLHWSIFTFVPGVLLNVCDLSSTIPKEIQFWITWQLYLID